MNVPQVDLTGLPFSSQVAEIYDRKFRLFFDMPNAVTVRPKLLADPEAKKEADNMIANASVFYLAS